MKVVASSRALATLTELAMTAAGLCTTSVLWAHANATQSDADGDDDDDRDGDGWSVAAHRRAAHALHVDRRR